MEDRKRYLSSIAIKYNDGRMEFSVGDAAIIRVTGGPNRIGLIRSIFELDSIKNCHIHWLGESAVGQPRELFLDDCQCDDVKAGCIEAKIDFHLLGPDDNLPASGRFGRYVAARSSITFLDPTSNEVCDSCYSKRLRHAREYAGRLPRGSPLGFKLDGEEYHLNDVVYLDEKRTAEAWTVGQIVKLPSIIGAEKKAAELMMEIRVLKRFSDLKRSGGIVSTEFVSERQLYLTAERKAISVDRIMGKCEDFECIVETESTTVNSIGEANFIPVQLPVCLTCSKQNNDKDREEFRKVAKMPSADSYSGGGGLVTAKSEFFQSVCALDMDQFCCLTILQNYPDVSVICSDLASASRLARRRDMGDLVPSSLPALPKRGDVLVYSACPPCQGHSGANHNRSADDHRNGELYTALCELDRLQPSFFIFENVPGFKRSLGEEEVDGVVTVSFAQRLLKELLQKGYQCRLALLDSRAYGSPQNRLRLFVLAARRGVKLPSLPEPTHANPVPQVINFKLEDDQPAVSFYVGRGTPGSGPLPAVTVCDALSDLPGFHFRPNDRTFLPRDRLPSFLPGRGRDGEMTRIGFLDQVAYATPPQNDYQALLRQERRTVFDHYTPYATPGDMEIIFASRDIRGIPFVGEKSDVPGCRRRINPSGGATTLLTSSKPGGKVTGALHYSQRRTLTIAERKRLSGFPDDYILCGPPSKQDEQLGNMVNVNVGRAISAEIHKVVFEWWRANGKPADPFRLWKEQYPVKPLEVPVIQ